MYTQMRDTTFNISATHGTRSPLKLLALMLGAAVSCVAAVAAVQDPSIDRPLLTVVIVGVLAVIGLRQPRVAVLLTFGFTVFLALIRRILIPASGWTSYDPLLLVAPATGGIILVRLLIFGSHRKTRDLLTGLVLGLLLITVVEAVNPLAGNLFAGLAGLLFMAVPLIWFFIGQEVGDRQTAVTIEGMVIALATLAAIYGLLQVFAGFPSWDRAWIELGGYGGIRVSGVVRPFSIFSSNVEYALYLGIGLTLSVAMLFHRKLLPVVVVPILALALFLASVRSAAVLTVVAILVLVAVRIAWRPRTILAVTTAIAGGILFLTTTAPFLDMAAAASGSPLIRHQVQGLLHPFDPNRSSLAVHVQIAADGIKDAISRPLGQGTAVTNFAGNTLASPARPTELDLPDALISLGLAGGLLFLAVLIVTLYRVTRLYRIQGDLPVLGVVGLLVVTFGQWLNGGHYATAPLVWFLIGWTNTEFGRRGSPSVDSP